MRTFTSIFLSTLIALTVFMQPQASWADATYEIVKRALDEAGLAPETLTEKFRNRYTEMHGANVCTEPNTDLIKITLDDLSLGFFIDLIQEPLEELGVDPLKAILDFACAAPATPAPPVCP